MSGSKESGSAAAKKSVFTLAASDNPGILIMQTQLKGPNYEEWAKEVKTALRAKKKMGVIDGSIKEPEEDSKELEDWVAVNSMIVSWIFNTVEPTLRSTISYMETGKELWDDIHQRFSVRNGARIHQLKTEVSNCKQNGESVMEYYARIKKIWDDLGDHDQLPICSCNGCKCNLTGKLEIRAEEEHVHQFLMGIDETPYSTVRSNIIASEPLPNMYRVYSQVTAQEQLKTMTKGPPEAMSFAVRTPGMRFTKGERKDDGLVCSHCHKLGHAVEACFKLNGYPEWWGDGQQGRGRGRGGTSGRGRGGPPRTNAVQAKANHTSAGLLGEEDKAGLKNLSNEDWSTLKSLWNSHTISSSTTTRLSGPHFEDADWSG